MRGRASAWSNASARLWRVEDVRATGYGSYPYSTYRTYSFNYTTNELLPHLTGIANHIASGDSYTLVYSPAANLYDPFGQSTVFGQTRNLTELRHSTLNLAHTFTYGFGSEMADSTNPHGGTLSWTHVTHIFANNRGIREIGTRTGPAGTHQFVRDASDSGRPFHPYTKLMDPDGQTDRYYRFDNTSTNPHYGYISEIEHTERSTGTVRLREAFTWAQDTLNRSYVGTATTTYDPAGTSAAKSVTQVVDSYGRLTSRTENDFTTSGYTPQSPRVTQYTYLTGSDYESRFIRDRIRTVTVSQGSQSYTLVDHTYDNYSGANSLVNRTGLLQHNTSSYGTGFSYRGNPTGTTRLGSAAITRRFDITGMATEIKEGSSTVTVEPTANNAVPHTITPNGQGSLSTTLSWNGFLGLTQVAGPNGASSSTTFDAYARKSGTTSPHGAPTAYSYTYLPNTVTAVTTTTVPGGVTRKRFARTTLDGFGRTIKEESGSGDPAATHQVLSVVDTEYGPCACSPLGKLKRVSRPRAPGGTVHWTTYSYDVLGRTTRVDLPASAGFTQFEYAANKVTITDPANKVKAHTQDGFGNLIRVTEAGTFETTYEYNVLGKLTTVRMPRNGYEQPRTFTYNSLGQLYQTTQPETGTKTFFYNSDGTLQYKTDAKGQKIAYTYDSYKRVTEVKRHKGSPGGPVLDPDQTTEYFYESNPFPGFVSPNGWGRLHAVRYWIKTDVSPSPNRLMPVVEMYSYTSAGAITNKKLRVTYSTSNSTTGDLDLAYSYDNEGRVVTVTYPSTHDDSGNSVNGRVYTYGYDAASRLSSIVDDTTTPTVLQSVGYNAAGQVTGMTYGANGWNMTETRQYNDLGQLRLLQGAIDGSTVSNTYHYHPDQNNGRITALTSSYPAGLGPSETVNYTYDALNRLHQAEVTGGWKQQFYHDGWGNLNGYSGTGGAPPYNISPADPITNRAPGTYDNNGNQLVGNMPPTCYDIENRPTCSTPYSYAVGYAPDNRRIWEGAAYNDPAPDPDHDYSEDRFTLYGIDGQRVGIYRIRNRMSPPDTSINMRFVTMEENVWVGKKLLKTRKGTTTEVVFQDRLGSVLFRYNVATRAKKAYAYYPYGQSRGVNDPYAEDGFGTYTRLDINENYYADQRYYNAKNGRFHQPDPYQASGGPTDPASWNRYAYVEGDPVNFYDPSGLFAQAAQGQGPTIGGPVPPPPSGSGGGGGSSSSGEQPSLEWDYSLQGPIYQSAESARLNKLLNAAQYALKALRTDECNNLFNTRSKSFAPEDVLANILYGTPVSAGYGSRIGMIGAAEPGRANWHVQPVGPTLPNGQYTDGTSIRVDIMIPIDGPDSLDYASEYFIAETLIHELGHVYDLHQDLGGSALVNDAIGAVPGGQVINAKVMQPCSRALTRVVFGF